MTNKRQLVDQNLKHWIFSMAVILSLFAFVSPSVSSHSIANTKSTEQLLGAPKQKRSVSFFNTRVSCKKSSEKWNESIFAIEAFNRTIITSFKSNQPISDRINSKKVFLLHKHSDLDLDDHHSSMLRG